MVNNWTRIIHDWLYPATCVLCRRSSAGQLDLCAACLADLPCNACACRRCGLPLPAQPDAAAICGRCLHRPPPYARTQAPYLYQPPVDHLIHMLKFRQQLIYARVIGELLGRHLLARDDPRPQLILPVPLHDRRMRRRGFNQALEIGRVLAHRLGIPLDPHLCVRTRATAEQSGLPAKQRRANVRGAFALRRPIEAEYVAIVDDVITTGNTTIELAKTLRRSGVPRVDIWAFARAAPGP